MQRLGIIRDFLRRGQRPLCYFPSPVKIPPFLAPVAADLQRVDALIRARLDSDVVLVRQVAEYIVAGGGKRLRPALVLLSAGACGYPCGRAAAGEAHYELAAVIEFIHTATLLHDDVVDASDLRRGRRTANAEFGNAAAVLVGDFLYSRAFQMMPRAGSMRVMQVLADATNTIAEGEVLQLMNCHDPDVGEARYLDVVRRKTAKLFEAAARLGAVLAGAPEAVEAGLAEYGMRLGTAFQLIDDVLNYSSNEAAIGKSLGDDLAEGEVLQLMNCHDPDVGEARYLDVVRRKTAKLFEAAARLGAVLAEAPPAIEAGLTEYGMRLGTAFQLIDDVLDYSGDAAAIGKSLGDDLAEGKPTLPLIRAMASAPAAEAALVRRAIVEGGRGEFERVLAAVRASGALDYARAAAEREAQAARAALAPLTASAQRDSLLELASFSAARRS